MRMFYFTIITPFVVINVWNAIYLPDERVKIIHTACKNSFVIPPEKDITLKNLFTFSDIDVDDLRKYLESSSSTDNRNKGYIGNAE